MNTEDDTKLPDANTNSLSLTYGAYPERLPETRRLSTDVVREVDASEGIHPAAFERANAETRKSLYDVIVQLGFITSSAVILTAWFPWGHFLKSTPREVAAGPQSIWITDADVREIGLQNLTPLQRAVYEVCKLRTKGYLHAARDKCAEYILLLRQSHEHTNWLPVWQHYFEILYLLRQEAELSKACDRLLTLVPDSPEALYYRARIRIDSVPYRYESKLSRDEERRHKAELQKALDDCQTAEAILSQRKTKTAEQSFINMVRLCIADAYRRLWYVSGFSWDDDDGAREKSFEYLRKLPENSKEAIEMRLWLLRACDKHWYRLLRRDPDQRVIDGQTITQDALRNVIAHYERLMRGA